ncbi:NAD(P)-dependent oxidoreductase [Kitasatospora sp. NPDC054939]
MSSTTTPATAGVEVGVLGLGAMGTALADALLTAGHRVTVWNRTPARAEPLVARGAVRAADVTGAVSAADLVVACVLDYDALRALLAGSEPALAGRTLVNLTSGSPEQARATADWAAGLGITYLDGAIMNTPPNIGSPGTMLLYSGAPDALAAHRGTLAALGDPIDLGTDPGSASLYDTALLGLMWSTLGGWLHGTALTRADGVPATEFTRVANRWLSDAVTGFLTAYAPQADAGAYPGDDATLDVHLAAMEHLLHASRDRGVDTALPELFHRQTARAIAEGHGADSYARLIEVITN